MPTISDDAAFLSAERVFFGTNRVPDGNGGFGFERSFDLKLGQATVSVPPDRVVGTVPYDPTNPNPQVDFALVDQSGFETRSDFRLAVNDSSYIDGSDAREVTLFVHGFNTSFPEALFRMAQMKHDLELPGASVVYSWPSRARTLGYEYDDDSITFARDGLEDLLRTLGDRRGARVFLVAHSMGSELAMETLRQIEIADPGWTDTFLDGVILISPDIDLDVFRSQMRALKVVPDPFVVFTSETDRALDLSSFLTGRSQRLGNLTDPTLVADLPISLVDVSAFSEDSGLNHFIPASSPALIALFRRSDRLNREFLRGNSSARPSILNVDRSRVQNATSFVLSGEER